MDDMNISHHIAIASEAFLQLITILSRILTVSAAVAFAVTTMGIIWFCLNEGRKRLPRKVSAGEFARTPRKDVRVPIKLSVESQRERMTLSAQRRRA